MQRCGGAVVGQPTDPHGAGRPLRRGDFVGGEERAVGHIVPVLQLLTSLPYVATEHCRALLRMIEYSRVL